MTSEKKKKRVSGAHSRDCPMSPHFPRLDLHFEIMRDTRTAHDEINGPRIEMKPEC